MECPFCHSDERTTILFFDFENEEVLLKCKKCKHDFTVKEK